MIDLTEQWKKGELSNGNYYVEIQDGSKMPVYMYKMRSRKNKVVYRIKAFTGFITKNQMKSVLSELPTYEEWQAQQNYEEHQKKCISIYENKEKQHTDDAIAYNELKEKFDIQKELIKEIIVKLRETEADCNTLCNKLLLTNPDLREWLETNFKEYL